MVKLTYELRVQLSMYTLGARGTQAWNFLHKVDFGHNLTIEVHCTSLNEIQTLLVEIWHTKGF